MAGSPEVRSNALEGYKNFNKLTLVGSLGFAAVASFVAPELVFPALALAAVDVTQIVIIDRINKKKPEAHTVYEYKQSDLALAA